MLTLALIAIPALLGGLILVFGSRMARQLALFVSFIQVALALAAFVALRNGQTDLLGFNEGWIGPLGLRFAFELDGISMVLVLLTAICTPLIIYSTFGKPLTNPHIFYGLTFFMISAMTGAFTAADGLMFYIFYEVALIPIYFICLTWGSGVNKVKVTLRFFLYTLFGSLFMLLSLLYVYHHTPNGSFALADLYAAGRSLSSFEQGWVFAGLFIAFAVKMPVFPFHTWQPSTYQTAPTAGTMLLAALMLKMATYGLIRLAIPMVPDGILEYGNWAVVLSVISIVYASLLAMYQKNYKLLIAYSSIAHVGLISAGILSGGETGIAGGVFEMFSHGILAIGLFFVYDIIEQRIHSDDMSLMGGIRGTNPLFAFLFFVIVMGSVALPFTSGFVGEFLLIQGLASLNPWLAGIGGLTVILGAVYMLRAFQTMMLGNANTLTSHFAPLTTQERIILITVVILVLALGIYPAPLLQLADGSITHLLGTFH
jgi:NADH-quinone oxidoreductase subunit M